MRTGRRSALIAARMTAATKAIAKSRNPTPGTSHAVATRARVATPTVATPRRTSAPGPPAQRSARWSWVVETPAVAEIQFGLVTFQALRAEHDGRRGLFGPRADALGYRIDGASRLYFAGDTDLFAEMSLLAGGVDVALLPVLVFSARPAT